MTAPFALPWGTFAALVVVAATIALAVIWSAVTARGGGKEDGDE